MRLALGLGVVVGSAALFVALLAAADAPTSGRGPPPAKSAPPSAAPSASAPPKRPPSAPRAPLWAKPTQVPDEQPRRVVIDRVVAIVGHDIITLTALRRRAAPIQRAFFTLPVAQQIELSRNAEREVLDQMIDDVLIANAAAKKSITVSESEIDAAIEKVEAENGLTREALQKVIIESHSTEEDYRADLKRQVLRYKVLEAVIVPRTATKAPVAGAQWSKVLDAEFKTWSAEQRVEALVEVRL